MTEMMIVKISIRFLTIILLFLSVNVHGQNAWTEQVYNPDVKNIEHNPLKGIVPGYTNIRSDFPYSVDHFYIPLKGTFLDRDVFDWSGFDSELDRITQKGCHSVVRFYIDYPGREYAMPGFLQDVVPYHEYDKGKSPYWNNDTLLQALENFIAAFGARYDGDPRIAMIEAGLYGFWGEWHNYPHNEWDLTRENKDRLFTAYLNAFDRTFIGMRQPDHLSTPELRMSCGYFNDQAFYATLGPQPWHQWMKMIATGCTENYKYFPQGGEIHPPTQSELWDNWPNTVGEDIPTCLRTSRTSWAKGWYLYGNIPSAAEWENALKTHKMMGYQFYVRSVQIMEDPKDSVTVNVNIQNRGVAPFYFNWDVEIAAVSNTGKWLGVLGNADWDIPSIMPDSSDYLRTSTVPLPENADYRILMRFVNPLEAYTSKARPLRFANELQDYDRKGWLTLGSVKPLNED